MSFTFQECSTPGNIDKPEIPDIGVASIVVDEKPLKHDAPPGVPACVSRSCV